MFSDFFVPRFENASPDQKIILLVDLADPNFLRPSTVCSRGLLSTVEDVSETDPPAQIHVAIAPWYEAVTFDAGTTWVQLARARVSSLCVPYLAGALSPSGQWWFGFCDELTFYQCVPQLLLLAAQGKFDDDRGGNGAKQRRPLPLANRRLYRDVTQIDVSSLSGVVAC